VSTPSGVFGGIDRKRVFQITLCRSYSPYHGLIYCTERLQRWRFFSTF